MTVEVKPRKERKANADKRREQLLDATLRSIANNGLAKTTLATVATEAGLSQGVAVFYFKSKTGLLTEALRAKYQKYERNWTKAIDANKGDPSEQLVSLIKADFAPEICNAESLAIWYSFWGEQNFTTEFAEVTNEFDNRRADAMVMVCRNLIDGISDEEANRIAEWIDTMIDGFWLRLHVNADVYTREGATSEILKLVERLIPSFTKT
jgi:TetR/AcrR family transcriptional repressor of bet genes